MDDVDTRLERILPILEDRVSIQLKKFEETLNVDSFVKPIIKGIKNRNEKIETKKKLIEFHKTIMPIAFKPIMEMEEMQDMAKIGVANILQAMGYKTKIDSTLKGYSGNTYYVSVLAPTQYRTLIVDQTVLSSQLMGWLNVELPKTFNTSKVTIADFFKYIDISLALKEKPAIYWLHDYKVSPEIADKVGFNLKRLSTEMAYEFGRRKGMSDEEINKALLTDEEFKEMTNTMDKFLSGTMKSFTKPILNLTAKNPLLPFDVRKTAKRFYIPYISTSLLDILQASTLNPKSSSDSRYLKGISVELGLLDFLNPPWPDYILEKARHGKSTFEEASNILTAAEYVGHPSRSVKDLAITPKKVIADPADGIEALEQHGLVTVDQKETYKITPNGREYTKEVLKRPKINALKKAAEFLKDHFPLGLSFMQINFK